MFDRTKIYKNDSGTRFLCACLCDSSETATYIAASFLLGVREYCFAADLYAKDSTVILDTPSLEETEALIALLNNSIAKMH